MRSDACPAPDDLFRWTAGHFIGSDLGLALAEHVAECTDDCPGFVEASEAAVSVVLETTDVPRGTPAPRRSTAELLREAQAFDEATASLFVAPPAKWAELLATHPLRGRPLFLYRVADRAVFFADERPGEVCAVLALLDHFAIEALREGASAADVTDVRGVVRLAEGVTMQARGRHTAALVMFERAERAWPDPKASADQPRIDLARAYSYRRLGRIADARSALASARDGLERWGLRGAGKVLWQLANLEWAVGNHRASLRAANQARKLLKDEGSEHDARLVLQSATLSLIALGRRRSARGILKKLERDPGVREVPQHLARIRWNLAEIAAAEGDLDEALELLELVVATFVEGGNLAAAASALLDMATVAWDAGDPIRQAVAAERAVSLLAQLPGLDRELVAASAQLLDALRQGASGLAIATTARRVRGLLKA